jgi:hypothetical protein
MLFDINRYDVLIAIILFVTAAIALFRIFASYITSVLDPLVFHIFWLSSTSAMLGLLFAKDPNNINTLGFCIAMLVYILGAKFFIQKYNRRKLKACRNNKNSELYFSFKFGYLNDKSYIIIVLVLFLLITYSKLDFYQYALGVSSYQELYYYRFIDLQGREALPRLIQTGTSSYLYFFLMGGLFRRGKSRKIAITILVFDLFVNIIAGGRSSLISLGQTFGSYLFFYKAEMPIKIFRLTNMVGTVIIILSLLLAAYVSSQYTADANFSDGLGIIFNRIFAAADGIEYYMNNDGDVNLDSGLNHYFLSVFGIYLKNLNLIDTDYKNIGWQLTELTKGETVAFAQGANYTFLLQGSVLSPYLVSIYPIISAFLMARMRNIWNSNVLYHPFCYSIFSLSLSTAIDLELAVFVFISSAICFLFFVFPLLLLLSRKPTIKTTNSTQICYSGSWTNEVRSK